MHIIIKNQAGTVIASSVLDGENLINLEGNYYFHPKHVQLKYLKEDKQDTYTCPWKGTCYYLHLIDPETQNVIAKEVAWIYPQPSELARKIAGFVGFYGTSRNGLEVSKSE
jgi:uncharacterized protein (DUF427 family)